jgi:hypothetical protein
MTTEMIIMGITIIALAGVTAVAMLVEATRRHLAGVRLEHAVRRDGDRYQRR